LPLDLLPPGQLADVADVCGEPGWVGRMAELGIQSGSRLRMLKSGSPCLVQIGNTQYCVRGSCDCQILVCPVSEARS
jgi:ferrous iron transport protein A